MLEKGLWEVRPGEVISTPHDCCLSAMGVTHPGAIRAECGAGEQSYLYMRHICINTFFLVSTGGITLELYTGGITVELYFGERR